MIEDIIKSIRQEDFVLRHDLVPSRKLPYSLDVRCYLCEMAVFEVLKKYDFKKVIDFSSANKYGWVRDDRGIKVFKGKDTFHEYDEIGYFDSDPLVVEVKSSKFNGYRKKINRSFQVAKSLFHRPASQLLFIPFGNEKQEIASELELKNNFYCIDTGWSKPELTDAVEKFYDYQKSLL